MGSIKTNELRNSTILDIYYDYMHENGFCSFREFAKWLTKQPAPRFYVEFETARRFVSLILRNKQPKCKAVYYDLAEIFRYRYRPAVIGIGRRVDYTPLLDMIEEPAPSFYLSVESITGILYREVRSRLRVKK